MPRNEKGMKMKMIIKDLLSQIHFIATAVFIPFVNSFFSFSFVKSILSTLLELSITFLFLFLILFLFAVYYNHSLLRLCHSIFHLVLLIKSYQLYCQPYSISLSFSFSLSLPFINFSILRLSLSSLNDIVYSLFSNFIYPLKVNAVCTPSSLFLSLSVTMFLSLCSFYFFLIFLHSPLVQTHSSSPSSSFSFIDCNIRSAPFLIRRINPFSWTCPISKMKNGIVEKDKSFESRIFFVILTRFKCYKC